MYAGETTTLSLNRLLSNVTIFKGTFPSDKVPIRKTEGVEAFKINTKPSTHEGEHWIAVVMTKNNCNYFDSFGKQLLDLEILSKLKAAGVLKYDFNTTPIQHPLSNNCGYYCAAFIVSFEKGIPYESFVNMFSKSLIEIEKICHNFLKKNIFS